MGLANILADNQEYLKVNNIEKAMGLKKTALVRIIARKNIPEKHKKQIEDWWKNWMVSLGAEPKLNFNSELKNKFEKMGLTSSQQVISFLEEFYMSNLDKVVQANNLPDNKKEILKQRQTSIADLTKPTNVVKPFEQPKTNFTIQRSFDFYKKTVAGIKNTNDWIELRDSILVAANLTTEQKQILISQKEK